MRRQIQRFLRNASTDESGASALEFAIVAPVFFILIFGIIVYGYYFATLSFVNHIAYEAARASVSGLDDEERVALAEARANELIDSLRGFLGSGSVEVDAAPAGEGLFSVTVHHHLDFLQSLGVASILPVPSADESATVQVSHGGY